MPLTLYQSLSLPFSFLPFSPYSTTINFISLFLSSQSLNHYYSQVAVAKTPRTHLPHSVQNRRFKHIDMEAGRCRLDYKPVVVGM